MPLDKHRVLMVVHAYYKDDTRVRREAEALVDAGRQVDIICLANGDEPKIEAFKGVNIYRCPIGRSKSKSKASYILEYISFVLLAFFSVTTRFFKHKYAVVVIHNMPNFLVFSALVPRIFGAKLVLDMHDIMPELYTNLFKIKDGFLKRLLYLEEKLSAALCQRHITVNTYIGKLLGKRLSKSFTIIHNTPDPNALIVPERTHKSVDAPLLLLHHGNIQKRYGLERVLNVLDVVNSNVTQGVCLEVHGLGPYYDDIKQIAADKGIAHLCAFHGRFTPETIGEPLSRADIGLVPNYHDEFADVLLPVKLLEYVAAGVPVITSPMKAVYEAFGDDCLFFFEDEESLAEQICYIKQHPEEAARKVMLAKEKLQAISWTAEKQKYVQFIDEIANA